MRPYRLPLFLLLTLLGHPGPLPAAEPAVADLPTAASVVALARARLGGEAKLNAIATLRYGGAFENYAEKKRGSFRIYLKRPLRQRTEYDDGTHTTTNAFDGLEGWSRVARNGDPEAYQLRVLTPVQLRRMRYNTLDNLYFFTRVEEEGGSIRVIGPAVMDGIDCWLLQFRFDEDNLFKRYFDRSNATLVATVSPSGLTIREMGELLVEGLRFPRVVDAYFEGRLVNRIVYGEIGLNEDLPDSLFEFPAIAPPQLGE